MNKKLIYIAGYGRSGSTHLEQMLSTGRDIKSLGEISHFERFSKDRKYLRTDEYLAEIRNISDDIYHLMNSQKHDCLFSSPFHKERYKKSLLNFIECIQQDTIVDGSKTSIYSILRPKIYLDLGFQVTIIHLKRKNLSLKRSLLKGKNSDLEEGKTVSVYRRYLDTLKGMIHARVSNSLTKLFYGNCKGYIQLDSSEIDDWLRDNQANLGLGVLKQSYGLGGNRLVRK